MDVSVIIVNYKTSNLIIDCVRSIISLTTGISYELIIVDNNSEPDFDKIIIKGADLTPENNFEFVSLPENIGFGRANNEGLKRAKGRNILFLNPDTVLINNAIKILSDFLDTHPKAGACGGNLLDENLLPTNSFKRLLPGLLTDLDELLNTIPQKIFFGKNRNYNFTDSPLKVGYITGADLMIKKDILEETGGFCPEFFMYFEETDLCFKIKRQGLEIFCVPDAKIQHLESKSFLNNEYWQSEFKTKLLEESRKIYYKRNVGFLSRTMSDMIYSVFLKTRILLIKNIKKKDYYKLRLKYFLEK